MKLKVILIMLLTISGFNPLFTYIYTYRTLWILIIQKGQNFMEFSEIVSELKKHEQTPEFENYVNGLLNDDRVSKYLESENGKKMIQPKLDSYFSKGLETWKSNNLSGLVDAKVKELYPEADPKDTELAQLKKELERIKSEAIRKDLTNKALQIANEKGLPIDLIDYFVGADEKTTTANLEKFEKVFASSLSSAVENKLKDNSYVPPNGDTEPIDGVTAAFAKLNPNIKID